MLQRPTFPFFFEKQRCRRLSKPADKRSVSKRSLRCRIYYIYRFYTKNFPRIFILYNECRFLNSRIASAKFPNCQCKVPELPVPARTPFSFVVILLSIRKAESYKIFQLLTFSLGVRRRGFKRDYLE